ncbi:hypothetical protein PYW08_009291 [Mythimna loreyi]|uniref:Uncharacterized protein n=1 Tax=Mythimna loreyi TaxID=667449 RepID=A0ACC2QAV0_9NEOP|nr:hypothetical protein PYW08_009291 [Mythimna loreyi]
MSDSESDASNNVFSFQNSITTVNARGPNTNFSFRNPMTSTMSRNFERPRYAESAYDQRSMYYRRETSPMSIQSACDMRQRNYHQYAGMSSRHSVYTGRGGSPMSMRSIDSSVSVSAADIAFAFNNGKFNRKDCRLIREAYQKFLKQRVRKRIEKKRNMRLHLKSRRRSGYDSGEQASDSSVSSDDRRSVRTYQENMSSRSTKTDLRDFRNTFHDRNMHKETPAQFSSFTFKNKFSVGSSSSSNTHNFNNTVMSNQFNAMPTQKDRFRNGFLLPSQRFNRSVASSAIMEDTGKPHKTLENNVVNNINRNNCPSSEEEIFSTTVREKSSFNIEKQHKRSFDSENEPSLPDSKRTKLMSPVKNKRALPKKNPIPPNNNVNLSNSFQFAKPSLPVRKSKHQIQEKLIAKSSQPLTDFLEPMPKKVQENMQPEPTNTQEKSNDNLSQVEQSDMTQNSDVSSRPSFIKRKLFTQKLDVTEKANISSDSTNSPQSSTHTLQKEKNKARKLVTNQSCLNREVNDDSNLLDLIHKIVPPDRINLSNQTAINQTKNVQNKTDNNTKWDVTSVISMCNEDDASDTYTDEEIFKTDNTLKNNVNNCKVVVTKLANNILQKQVVNQNFTLTHNNITTNNTKNPGKTFWDTDFESDAECQTVLPRSHIVDNLIKAPLNNTKQDFKDDTGYARSEISKKSLQAAEFPKRLNTSLLNTTTSNNTLIMKPGTLTVRSHRTSKKKKGFNETCTNESNPNLEKKKDNNSKVPTENNTKITNSKPNVQNKNTTEVSRPKPNTQNEKIHTAIRSQSPKSNKKSKKSKSEKTSSVSNKNSNTDLQNNHQSANKKSEKQNDTKVKNNAKVNNDPIVKSDPKAKTDPVAKVKNDSKAKNDPKVKNDPKIKPQKENQQNKKQKSPKSKSKPKQSDQHNETQSKKNKPVLKPTNSNLNTTIEPVQRASFGLENKPQSPKKHLLEVKQTKGKEKLEIGENKCLKGLEQFSLINNIFVMKLVLFLQHLILNYY